MSVRQYLSLGDVKEQWMHSCCLTPFQTYAWSSNFWKYLSGNKRLFVLATTRTILPLQIKIVDSLRVVEIIGSRGSDYLNYIGDPYDLPEIIEYLCNQTFWDIIRFEDIPSSSELLNTAMYPSYFYTARQENVECISVYLPPCQPKHTYRDRDRYMRTLKSLKHRFVFDDSFSKLEHYVSIYQRRRHFKNSKGAFDESRSRHFLFSFLSTLATQQELVLSGLYIGEELAAGVISSARNCILFALYTGFLDGYKKHAPGFLLHNFILEEASRQGFYAYDLTRGGEWYKKRLGGRVSHTMLFEVYRSTIQYHAYKKAYERRYKKVGYEPNEL